MKAASPRAGIVAIAAYLPNYRLTAEEIGRAQRRPNGSRAQRRLAGFDEDALTMSVAAARCLPELRVDSLLFCTTTPPYLAKNNASAAHAALQLPEAVSAVDCGGSYRSGLGALLHARPGALLLCADISTSRPGAASELAHGDAAAALVLGDADEAIAEIVASVSLTEEFLDHYRLGDTAGVSTSEDRFAPSRYAPLLAQALQELDTDALDHVIVSAPSAKVAQMARQVLGKVGPVYAHAGVGYAGCADFAVQLAAVLAAAAPGQRILLALLADGCDLVLLRCTELLRQHRPAALPRPTAGAVPAYLDALTWRGLLEREPPRRPEPAPVSAPASARSVRWKFALQGVACSACGGVSCPPQQVCVRCGAHSPGAPVDLSRRDATIKTFSVDRLAYSPNPPLIAAVVDFDGGGRLEVELTDTAPESLAVGQRVRMSLRRRHSGGGVHNYAWKAVPLEQAHGE